MRINVVILLLAVAASAQTFDAASIKANNSGARPWLAPPVGGRFAATNVTLTMLIGTGWPQLGVTGGPSWLATQGFDVITKAPDGAIDREQFAAMMRSLLKDRFKLRLHEETREAPVYALLPAKGGLKLPNAHPESCTTWGITTRGAQIGCDPMNATPESITDERLSMPWLAAVLGGMVGRPVIDKTGFNGSFKVQLEFAASNDANSAKPSIFTALQEQLGLRLESQKGSVGILVVDHAEKPSEN
jgi:uncharacterized protein (TIGR03435 family)